MNHLGFIEAFKRQPGEVVDRERTVHNLRLCQRQSGDRDVLWCLWLLYFGVLTRTWCNPSAYFDVDRVAQIQQHAADFSLEADVLKEDHSSN